MNYNDDDSLTVDSFKGKTVKEIEVGDGSVVISFSDETQIEIEAEAKYIGTGDYVGEIRFYYSKPTSPMWHLLES